MNNALTLLSDRDNRRAILDAEILRPSILSPLTRDQQYAAQLLEIEYQTWMRHLASGGFLAATYANIVRNLAQEVR